MFTRPALICAALVSVATLLVGEGCATAQQVQVPAFTLPPSDQLSPQALQVLRQMKAETAPDSISGNLAKQRAFYGAWNDRRLGEMRARFKTTIHHAMMNGVGVDIVDPVDGVTETNKDRVLINVHGGAFLWGAGSGALVEAIPIAATGRIRVVTVDYRLAPEHHYPAASEDVAAVYRALLKRYRPENIGIYGCSAGGIITAQATAWIGAHGLPKPGAIGTFCGTGAPYSGDSPYLAGPITGGKPQSQIPLPDTLTTAYLTGVSANDPLAYPLTNDVQTHTMPPTLLLSGGRDFAVSASTLAHRRLAASGVESELYLFDGLPHAFFMWPDMPESQEAYRIIAQFFHRHLGRQSRTGR